MKKNILMISLVLIFALTVSAVAASENTDDVSSIDNDTSAVQSIDADTVDSKVDDNVLSSDENGNAEVGVSDENKLSTTHEFSGTTFKDLQTQINNAHSGDIIVLNKDCKYQIGTDTITEGIVINKALTINGNGHIIDAQLKSRIFHINSSNVIINNIVFVNGNNTGNGSAILLTANHTMITNCNFINNTAGMHGGAIFINNFTVNHTIKNCNFINNSAYRGGVIHCQDENLTISDCKFINNYAIRNGGGIQPTYEIEDSGIGCKNLIVRDCDFINNKAGNNGGAIGAWCINGSIIDCNFINNTAGGNGGGVYFDGYWIDSVNYKKNKGLVSGCTFINNTAGITSTSSVGGGLQSQCANLVIENCLFKNNTAKSTEGGGGLSLGANAFNNSVINCTIINNTGAKGAGLRVCQPSTIKDCTISDNDGYALYFYSNAVEVTMSNNTINGPVFSNYVKFLSKTNIIILNNSTVCADTNSSILITAVITDDNDNPVSTPSLSFKLQNGTTITATRNATTNIWTAKYTFKQYGNYVITAVPDSKLTNVTIYTGTLDIRQNTTLKIEYNNITTLDDLFVIAYVNNTATGSVTFTVGNENYTRDVANGEAVLILKKHLSVGEYNLTVRYNGGDAYRPVVEKAVLNVKAATNPVISIFADEVINVDTSVILNASANYNVDADFYFIILKDNVEITRVLATKTGGIYFAEYVFTNKGNYQISASYGDIKGLVVNNGTVTVNMPCVIDVNVSDALYGSDVILNISVPLNATGVIGIIINNNVTNFTLPADHGETILYNAGKLPVNDYTVVVVYESDNNYGPAAAYANFKVDKIQTLITINNPGSVVVGDTLTISFTTNSNATYALKLNGEVIANNTQYTPLKEGVYAITVEMDANTWFGSGFNMTTFTVNPKPLPVDPKMNLTYNANPKLGDNITVVVSLPSDVNGTVTLLINNKTNATFNVVNGKANVTIKGVSDKNTYEVYYAGSDRYFETTKALDLNVVLPTTLTAPGVTCIYNDDAYLVITLKDVYGNAVKNTVISVNLNGAKNLTTDNNGQVKVSLLNMAPNTYNAVISFAGTSKYIKTNATAKVTVNKATPKLTAKNKKFKKKLKTKKYSVTLKTNKNKALAKVKLTLKIKKKTYKATTNAKGKATFKIKKLTKKGKYKSTVTFAGNAYYNKVSKKVTITVK